MIAKQFKVYIDKAWLNVFPIFETFKIKKERDKKDVLVVRTVSDTVISFNCNDFELLKDYAINNIDIDCRFTEVDCAGNEYGHEAFLVFDNKIDFANKIIEATVKIKDEYHNLFNNQNNIDTQFNNTIPVLFTPSRRVSTYNSFQDASMTTNATSLIYLLNYYLNNFINLGGITVDIPVRFSNVSICDNQKFLNKFDNKKSNSNLDNFNYSLQDILNFLRDNFFLYYYIDSNTNSFKLVHYKGFDRANDINIELSRSEKELTFDKNKYSVRVYKKPDLNTEIKYYYLNSKENSEEKINLQGSVSTISTNEKNTRTATFLLLDTIKYDSSNIETQQAITDLSQISKQFDVFKILENQFVAGDFDEITITNKVNSLYKLEVFTREMFLNQNEKLSFFFTGIEGLPDSFKASYFRIYRMSGDTQDTDLDTLVYERKLFDIAIVPNPAGGFDFGEGFNIPVTQTGWYYCVIYMKGSFSNASITIKNFDMFFDKDYVYSARSFEGGRPNDYLSLERFIRNYGCEFQSDKIKLESNEIVNVTPKNLINLNVDIQQSENINNYDFESNFITELGTFTAYELEEIHTFKTKKFSKLTLKSNKNDIL